MTADDDDIDDASLKSMRAVWLSMRDEEPPSAGMSALMAAAAAKADQLREKEQPAWWERVFAMLRKPPVLAFATVMILIGGAVLVTRTEQERAEPMVTTEAPATAVEKRAAPVIAEPAPAPAVEAQREVEPAEKPRDVVPPAPKKQRPKPERAQTYREEAAALEETKTGAAKDIDAPVDTAGTALESPPPAPPPKPRMPVAPRPEPAPTKAAEPAPTKAAEPAEDSVAGRAAPKTPPVEQLAKQAESAAARGDCAAVRTLAERIKQQDAAVYKRIAREAAIAKCLY